MVRDSLADGLLTEDCAGLLAERLGAGWTIVLDDLHHLEPDAPALVPLRTFLRYLPADAMAVLVSRRMPSVDLFHGLLTDQLSGVFDDELAFSLDETQALLEAREVDVDPARSTGPPAGGPRGSSSRPCGRPRAGRRSRRPRDRSSRTSGTRSCTSSRPACAARSCGPRCSTRSRRSGSRGCPRRGRP